MKIELNCKIASQENYTEVGQNTSLFHSYAKFMECKNIRPIKKQERHDSSINPNMVKEDTNNTRNLPRNFAAKLHVIRHSKI